MKYFNFFFNHNWKASFAEIQDGEMASKVVKESEIDASVLQTINKIKNKELISDGENISFDVHIDDYDVYSGIQNYRVGDLHLQNRFSGSVNSL